MKTRVTYQNSKAVSCCVKMSGTYSTSQLIFPRAKKLGMNSRRFTKFYGSKQDAGGECTYLCTYYRREYCC